MVVVYKPEGNQDLNKAVFAGRSDYLILKMSENFPYTPVGADIDILCDSEFMIHVFKVLGTECKGHAREDGYQVDSYKNGKFNIKYDLLYSLDKYGLVEKSVFDASRYTLRSGRPFRVPSYEDELRIRLVEYMKYPKKTWHRDYILKHGAPGLLSDMGTRT